MKTKGKQIEIEISNTKNKLSKYLRTYRSRFFLPGNIQISRQLQTTCPFQNKKKSQFFYTLRLERKMRSHISRN